MATCSSRTEKLTGSGHDVVLERILEDMRTAEVDDLHDAAVTNHDVI